MAAQQEHCEEQRVWGRRLGRGCAPRGGGSPGEASLGSPRVGHMQLEPHRAPQGALSSWPLWAPILPVPPLGPPGSGQGSGIKQA